jgi:FKBP-type peptidyl-prolyl cis-trans isomerase SlyD
MKIATNCVVSLDYSLHLGNGEIIDSSEEEPLIFLHGAGQIVPGLEKHLEGMIPGQHKKVVLTPVEGYGEHDPQNVQTLNKDAFGGRDVQTGDEFVAIDDEEREIPVRIENVEGDLVTVDFNHPLAGKTLHFSVTVRDVRAATNDEIQHGHAHQSEILH